jgi:hypothetical protein
MSETARKETAGCVAATRARAVPMRPDPTIPNPIGLRTRGIAELVEGLLMGVIDT